MTDLFQDLMEITTNEKDNSGDFEVFWLAYPRKQGKQMAKKAWSKLNPAQREKAQAEILNHIKYWSLHETAQCFIPHCSTWLNQERFEDELVIEQKENKRFALPWYSTDELTLAKGRELGLQPYAGESFAQFRTRISAKISSVGVGA